MFLRHCVVLLTAWAYVTAAAAEECSNWLAQIEAIEGRVEVNRKDSVNWTTARYGEQLCAGDGIRTGPNSRAAVWFRDDETVARLDQRSTLTLIEKDGSFINQLLEGALHLFTRTPRRLQVDTPYVNAAVDGTEFLVRVQTDSTLIVVFEGAVIASNAAGSLRLTDGQTALTRAGSAPVLLAEIRPTDAVQWALYYPPVLAEPAAGDTAAQAVQQAAESVAVGRIDEARALLAQYPNDGRAVALEAVIAIARNEREQALALAQQAVQLSPDDPTPYLALSYAEQARFELAAARAAAEAAVQRAPQAALAYARLAEVQLAQRDLSGALASAQQAVALDPALSRTQTVLGFANLLRLDIDPARVAFLAAIKLDQADPLPRLGLGLARIHKGALVEGREAIELATGLDPADAILRSYLGKAYYEEKRADLAATQFALGKQIDPKDPTPWFYDALLDQSLNRPVSALLNLQQSIALNDNRAVYRSRELLDQDLAARGASLGRIYGELDFEQRALLEGWTSLDEDPGNFSAHRLLADNYAVLPRHEVARVSELLQSQLLQPLNLTPLQPQLAESDLGILSGAGPSELGFNEFNSLFIQEGLAIQGNGVFGGQGTVGNDLVFAGLVDKLSFSLGQFHYETDGYRENSDQTIDLYNAFVQYSPTFGTSVQAEYRYLDQEKGDLNQHLDPTDFVDTFRQDERKETIRLGARQALGPNSELLGSFIHEKRDLSAGFGVPMLSLFDIETDGSSRLLEMQHLYRGEQFKLVSGAGYIRREATDITALEFFGQRSVTTTERESRYRNAYVYSYLDPWPGLTLTLGLSGNEYEGQFGDETQLNPKFGLLWNVGQGTTLRAAAFRTLKQSLTADQTIEPTQVAGFNQFYDLESDTTDAWRYGIALDQRFAPTLYGGVEFALRELEEPIQVITQEAISQIASDNRESVGRAYLYWTPQPWLALSADYFYERFDRDRAFFLTPSSYVDLETHRVQLSGKIFHETGWSGGLRANYVDQTGLTQDNPTDPFTVPPAVTLKDDFWTLDAFVDYRLPGRYGRLSLEVLNLLDEEFNYEEIDPANPVVYPERLILGRFTLAF